MKASSILRGYLQIKPVRLPLAGVPNKDLFNAPHLRHLHKADVEAFREAHPDTEAPKPVDVGLLPLSPGQEADIITRAYEYAKGRGVENPSEKDELYVYGKALYRCLYGVVDIDSEPEHPERFFDEGIGQIEGMPELGRDGVLTLAEMHVAFQDEVTGNIQDLESDPKAFEAMLEEASGPLGDSLFFALRPGFRVSSWRSMASRLYVLLEARSYSGSSPSRSGSKTSKPRSRKGSSGAS